MSKKNKKDPAKKSVRSIHMELDGVVMEFVTISQLAKYGGKSPDTLRKWEIDGWLPRPNWLMEHNSSSIKDAKIRLYTKKYAELMGVEIQKVKKGFEIKDEVKLALSLLIKQEKEEFSKS